MSGSVRGAMEQSIVPTRLNRIVKVVSPDHKDAYADKCPLE